MSRLFSTRSGKLIVIVILLASLGLIIVQVQHVQNLLQNAQTPLTPPVTSPEGKKNPISWSSPQVSLMADDFYIMADGKKFLGNAADIQVHSDPGSMAYTTLEVTWFEGGVEMRINIYFDHREGDFWKVSEIRTYNGQTPGDWIYYKTIDGDSFLGNELGSPLILPRLDLGSDSSNSYNAYSGTVYFENLKLWPFLTYAVESGSTPTPLPASPTPTLTPIPPTATLTPTRIPTPTKKLALTRTPTPKPDRVKPRVQFIFPLNGVSLKKGKAVSMQVYASDNKGVVSVTLYVNSLKICTDTTALGSLYSCSWTVPNTTGSYTLKAIAADAGGNTASSTIKVSSK